MVFADMEIDPG